MGAKKSFADLKENKGRMTPIQPIVFRDALYLRLPNSIFSSLVDTFFCVIIVVIKKNFRFLLLFFKQNYIPTLKRIQIMLFKYLLIIVSISFQYNSYAEVFVYKDSNLPFPVKGDYDNIVENSSFTTSYNYDTKNPDWSSYNLKSDKVLLSNKRKDNFREDVRIPKEYRSKLSDYKKSGYDRGHIAPNAALDHTKESQDETFLLSNIVPQLPAHNRYGWKDLEAFVRDAAVEYGEIYVITGVSYDKDREYIGNKVEIPDYFYKIIYIPSLSDYIAFLTPHEKIDFSDPNKYLTTLEEIELITGYDFIYDE